MQPTGAMKSRMAKRYAPGMVVDLATTKGTVGVTVLGPSTSGDTTQLRVQFPDGAIGDCDATSFISPRGSSSSRSGSSSPDGGLVENQAWRDEMEVRDSPTRLGRSRDSTDREVKDRQKEEEAEVEQAVTPELAAWLAKRSLQNRGEVIAVSLQEAGCPSEEWTDMLNELESDGETMFKIFMQAVEKKYQADPAKFGGALPDTPRTTSSKKIAAAAAAGAVMVTVAAGGAGFVCNANMAVKKVTPGGASAAAGVMVGMELTGFTGGGRRQAMGGVSWAAFKEMCRQSSYPRVFTFTPMGGTASAALASRGVSEGIPGQQHSSASQTAAEQAEETRREILSRRSVGPLAVADVTVSFDGPGSLGLALIEDAGGRVLISEISSGTLAAAMPQLHAGMALRTFQPADGRWQPVDGMTYRSILGMLKSARPLQLGFDEGAHSEQATRSASPGNGSSRQFSAQISAQKQAMIAVAKERNTTAQKLHQHLKECPDDECREIVSRLKVVQAAISRAEADRVEEEEVKRAFAAAQAQTRLQEQVRSSLPLPARSAI